MKQKAKQKWRLMEVQEKSKIMNENQEHFFNLCLRCSQRNILRYVDHLTIDYGDDCDRL